jgi:hypothetical protein
MKKHKIRKRRKVCSTRHRNWVVVVMSEAASHWLRQLAAAIGLFPFYTHGHVGCGIPAGQPLQGYYAIERLGIRACNHLEMLNWELRALLFLQISQITLVET